MIVGAANPVHKSLELNTYPNLRSKYFLERREIGIINVGGDGEVSADGQTYTVDKLDCIYIGKGTEHVNFNSKDPANPAIFYLLSAPAHAFYPTSVMTHADAAKVNAGDTSTANRRTINKYIHMDGIKSCQLVMGLTILQEGSVWNTMPAHTHSRRSEIYMYFDVPADAMVVHLLGEPDELRALIIRNQEVALSPGWSVHSGCGTASYSFCWAMGGENQDYTDMDPVLVEMMR